jgi:kynurenine formamidase
VELFDLTLPLSPTLAVLPGDPPVTMERTASHQTHGFEVSRICLGSHSGTHVEAPRHFYPDGLTLDAFPLRRFTGPGVVLDCRSCETLADQLREWPLREDGLALLWTDGAPLPLSAAEMLADAGAGLVGTDAASIDDEPYEVHRFLLARDILIAENLANLERIGPGPVECALLPLALKNPDAAPARAIAWR